MTLPWDRFRLPVAPGADERVLVIGAGLAGCWLCRILAEKGVSTRLIDSRNGTGLGASGNPAGIFKPFVTRQPTNAMQFYLQAHSYLLQQLEELGLQTTCGFDTGGVLQLTRQAYPSSSSYHTLDTEQGKAVAGTALGSHSIHFPASGWLNPGLLCQQLVQHPLIDTRMGVDVQSVRSIDCGDGDCGDGQKVWQLRCAQGSTESSRYLVLANGERLAQFEPTSHLPITAARGQISRFVLKPDSPRPRCVISGKHYAIPDKDTLLVGATFARHDADEGVRSNDHRSNLAGLSCLLPDVTVEQDAVDGYAGVRATTPDRMPMVGPLADYEAVTTAYASLHHGKHLSTYPSLPVLEGLYVLGGLGSRGIVTAPLAAKMLADFLLQENSTDNACLLTHWAPLFNPARFQIRALKRRYT